ncbi:hypothetical protein JKY79_01180 [Candidatus Babeliales bacterium]|nr:hypothetical protein [Candidatus Babeliales bacterium]
MKLNATLLFQIGNFFILYWILKRFFLKKALSFLFESRDAIKKLETEEEQLTREKAAVIQTHQDTIQQFKSDIAKKERTLPRAQRSKLEVKKPLLNTEEFVELPNDITEQLVKIIEKECHHES